MRMFFITVGILSWLMALAVLWIFAASGGVLTMIAAGVFAGVAIVSLGLDRVLKALEEIRDRNAWHVQATAPMERDGRRERTTTAPSEAVPI